MSGDFTKFYSGGHNSNKEGDITIKTTGKRDKKISNDKGEYINYEEIKD